jgi:hypothetical protein
MTEFLQLSLENIHMSTSPKQRDAKIAPLKASFLPLFVNDFSEAQPIKVELDGEMSLPTLLKLLEDKTAISRECDCACE